MPNKNNNLIAYKSKYRIFIIFKTNMDVSIWINKMLESFQSNDIATVIKLLKDAKISSKGDIYMIVKKEVENNIEDPADQESFTEFATNYAMYMLHKQEKTSVLKAFNHMSNSVKNYSKFYQSNVISGSWSVELIDFLCNAIKELAYLAEKTYKTIGEEQKEITESPLKIAKVTLENVFNKCQSIKEPFPNSRKLAAFYVIIHICEMFFKANKFRICQRFVHWVEMLPEAFELLPEHIKVSYKYFEGLLCLFQNEYMKALKCLSYSFEKCKKEEIDFKCKVMKYLMPINILMGEFSDEATLKQYNIDEYKEILNACKNGKLKQFERGLSKHDEQFLKSGIYLVLEKLKNVVHRNFVMNIYLTNESNHIIKLDNCVEEFKKTNEDEKDDSDMDEDSDDELSVSGIECMLAGLIYKGFIKGYISHEKSVLVLSKKEPFPPLKNVIEKNGSNI